MDFENLHLLKHLLKLHLVNPIEVVPKKQSIVYKVLLDKKMKNKHKKPEWQNNFRFYRNLFGAASFREFHELVGDRRGLVDHFDGAKQSLGRGEYNLRKSSLDAEPERAARIDLKEYSEINTIKRNIITKVWDKPGNELDDKDGLYGSQEFNSGDSNRSDLFDTSSSIGDTEHNPVPSSLESSKDNDNIRLIIEQCIMEADSKAKESRPMSMKSIEELSTENPNYGDPFASLESGEPRPKPADKEEQQKPAFKTSFVKFRDIKYIQSYDFDTVDSNIVWNPLKESIAPTTSASTQNQAFSLQRTCFEKIENKLIYAMTEAFRSNSKEIDDTELLELIQQIFQNPGDQDTVTRFFKKGKSELEVSNKYLFRFHIVCKNFLSLEKEGLLRRQKRFIKSLGDFAIRRFVKDQEIGIIKRCEEIDEGTQRFKDDNSEISLATRSGFTTKSTRTTRIESKLHRDTSDAKATRDQQTRSKNTFYLVRKESRNSRIRKSPAAYEMPSIYVQPLILKAFRSAVGDSGKGFQMISALNVNDYYSAKDFKEVPRYSEQDVFAELKDKKYIIFSVQNLLEMFEMIFDKQKEMFEMKVKTNMIEYFLKKRFEIVKKQMMATFKELHLSSYFKDIHDLQGGGDHRYALIPAISAHGWSTCRARSRSTSFWRCRSCRWFISSRPLLRVRNRAARSTSS